LKKREIQLICKQNELKSLICGLVGGPALLKEWEREWKEKFGGQEKDEVEGEEMEPLSEDDEGDDDDGYDGFKEGQDGRARKKAKNVKEPKRERKPATVPATLQAALNMTSGHTQSTVPEKRKRGRPRKVTTLPSGPEDISMSHGTLADFVPHEIKTDDGQVVQPSTVQVPNQGFAPQYLLATFALFSFFNSPISTSFSSSMPSHTHSGEVLGHTHAQPLPFTRDNGYGWQEAIQVFHLVVSALVFLSIVVPWLPVALGRTKLLSFVSLAFPFSIKVVASSPKSPVSSAESKPRAAEKSVVSASLTLTDVLNDSCRGTSDEPRHTLGVSAGLGGLMQVSFKTKCDKGPGFEQKCRAWIRLGELAVLDRKFSLFLFFVRSQFKSIISLDTTSFLSHVQIYWCMSWYLSRFMASNTSDLSTLALIAYPLS
jgi:hypothetical protein